MTGARVSPIMPELLLQHHEWPEPAPRIKEAVCKGKHSRIVQDGSRQSEDRANQNWKRVLLDDTYKGRKIVWEIMLKC